LLRDLHIDLAVIAVTFCQNDIVAPGCGSPELPIGQGAASQAFQTRVV
jgi:hypothetical protein